jgi:hypothetical protein
MTSVIETALSPFRYFDMGTIYNVHTQIIDGIIFFSIFLGLSKFAFHKPFPEDLAMLRPDHRNHVWSYDFMMDRIH